MLRSLLFVMLLTQDSINNKRVLCIYANSADNPTYVEQLHLLATDGPGLKERDIVIKKFILNERTVADFRRRTVKGSFTVILIGKDGGEKYRYSKALTLQKLYAIVDAMPMRREEMRQKKHD